MTEEPKTEELKALQLEKAATEEDLARSAPDDSEAAQHERRADKAHYLQEKLEERARSEREVEGVEDADTQDPGPLTEP